MNADIAAQILNLPKEKFGPEQLLEDQYNDIIGGYALGCRDAAALLTSSPEIAEMERIREAAPVLILAAEMIEYYAAGKASVTAMQLRKMHAMLVSPPVPPSAGQE